MKFSKMMEQLHSVAYDQVRHVGSESLEAVIPRERLGDVLPILGAYFGMPLKAPDQSASAAVSEIAEPLGGIWEGQTLYYAERQAKREVAALWPWQDGDHVTLKVLMEPEEEIPADRTSLEKELRTEERAKVLEKSIQVLVVGPKESWAGNICTMLEQGGFKIQSATSGTELAELFKKKSYVPQAVLLYLSSVAGWPGSEVLHQINSYWLQTKLLVFAEEDVPWPVSLAAIRHSDHFHRGQEHWSRVGELIRRTLR